MNCFLTGVRLLGVLMAVPGAVAGQDIYKWQDAQGTTHYSEVPPPVEFSSFEVVDVPAAPGNEYAAGDYRAALEMANSLQAGRLQREKLRLEQERLARQEQQARLEAQRYNQTYRSPYNDSYYLYRYPAYAKPPYHRPRPPHYPPSGQVPPGSVQKRVYVGR